MRGVEDLVGECAWNDSEKGGDERCDQNPLAGHESPSSNKRTGTCMSAQRAAKRASRSQPACSGRPQAGRSMRLINAVRSTRRFRHCLSAGGVKRGDRPVAVDAADAMVLAVGDVEAALGIEGEPVWR